MNPSPHKDHLFNWAWDLAFEIENIYSPESHIEYFLNVEHLWRYFELFWLTSSIQENFSIKLSYLHIFFHRNFHSTNPYTKRCAVKFPIDWCMGLSTEKFTTKSSDHPKIGFWDLASGDAKSPKIIFWHFTGWPPTREHHLFPKSTIDLYSRTHAFQRFAPNTMVGLDYRPLYSRMVIMQSLGGSIPTYRRFQ